MGFWKGGGESANPNPRDGRGQRWLSCVLGTAKKTGRKETQGSESWKASGEDGGTKAMHGVTEGGPCAGPGPGGRFDHAGLAPVSSPQLGPSPGGL